MDKKISDEIDLMELLADAYYVIKRNFILFLVLPVAGAIIAVTNSYRGPDRYSSSMMVSTDLIGEKEAEFIARELGAADSMPGLTRLDRQKLLSLGFAVDSKIEKAITNKGMVADREVVFLTITAQVTDPSIFPSLETSVVRFVNSIDAIEQPRKRQEFLHRQVITKIDSELVILKGIHENADSKTMAGYMNPGDLFEKTLEIYENRAEREARLQYLSSVTLVKGFSSLAKSANLSSKFAGAVGAGVGLLLFAFIVFVRYFIGYVNSRKD
jgi:hypothetical protein